MNRRYLTDTFILRILLALIRDMGKFPCPRCLVPKSSLGWVGQKRDLAQRSEKRTSDVTLKNKVKRARALIYKKGFVIRSKKVEAILKPTSIQPTEVRQIYFFVCV
jgi:hypothetical protein